MNEYDVILFDLDGTLTDPGPGITRSVAYALRRMGITPPPLQELYPFIGPPLADCFMERCGMNAAEAAAAIRYFREYFRDRGIFENSVYDGIEPLLARLNEAGRSVVLATSKPEEFALRILDHFGLRSYFSHAAGATMDETRSRKGDVIALALDRCSAGGRSRVVMVGDRKHDIIGAKEHDLASIGVLYGYGSREELTEAGADHIAATVQELEALLLP